MTYFDSNREIINNINITTNFLRQQNFYWGMDYLRQVLAMFQENVDHILSIATELGEAESLVQTIGALMDAQEMQDYSFVADILEGDLLPIMQHVQLQEEAAIDENIWQKNAGALGQSHPELMAALQSGFASDERYQESLAINGSLTALYSDGSQQIHLHSTVNPELEARLWVESLEIGDHNILLYGLGLGYHVKELLVSDRRDRVTVLEPSMDLISIALQCIDFSEEIASGRLRLVHVRDLGVDLSKAQETEPYLLIYYPSLQIMPASDIKEALRNYYLKLSTSMNQGNVLEVNFDLNLEQDYPECGQLQPMFKDKDVLLLAGGPSVDENMEAIRAKRDQYVMIAVGTIAGKLLRGGIRPDVVIVSDPQPEVANQIRNIEEDIPLIMLSTAYSEAGKLHKGQVYMAYQHGYEPAEELARERGYDLHKTGGSVSTTALSIAHDFGAKSITFCGLDLAYTDNKSHASGTNQVRQAEANDDMRAVESNTGDVVYAPMNLDVYRKWIENYIADVEIPIYNTGRGAKIKGTQWTEL